MRRSPSAEGIGLHAVIDLRLLREDPDTVRASQRARGDDEGLVDAVLAADERRRACLAEFERTRAEQKALGKQVASATPRDPPAPARADQGARRAGEVARGRRRRAADVELTDLLGADRQRRASPGPRSAARTTTSCCARSVRRATSPRRASPRRTTSSSASGSGRSTSTAARRSPAPGSTSSPGSGPGSSSRCSCARSTRRSPPGSRRSSPRRSSSRRSCAAPGSSARTRTRSTTCRPTTCTWSAPARSRSPATTATRSSTSRRGRGATPAGRPATAARPGRTARTPAGSSGVHQFHKVEMFSYCRVEDAREEHQRLLAWEEEMLAKVEIPYRVIDVAAGDLGSSAARKFDCEAWVPTQGRYREVTSTSNCTTYQARRLDVRETDPREGVTSNRLVATLNGTLATTRWIVAILENHQQPDGSVLVPEGAAAVPGRARRADAGPVTGPARRARHRRHGPRPRRGHHRAGPDGGRRTRGRRGRARRHRHRALAARAPCPSWTGSGSPRAGRCAATGR